MLRSDRQVLPLFLFPLGKLDPERDVRVSEQLVAHGRERVVPQVDQLERVRRDDLVPVDVDDGVVVGAQFAQLRHLEHDGGQRDEGVVRDVQLLQRVQVGQLVRQLGHLVVRQVELRDQAELDRKLGRYFRDDIAAEVARLQLSVSHQMVDRIWNLNQLALGEIQVLVSFASSHRFTTLATNEAIAHGGVQPVSLAGVLCRLPDPRLVKQQLLRTLKHRLSYSG